MFRLLLLACLAATCMADETEPAESAITIHRDDRHHERDRDYHRSHHADDHHRLHHDDGQHSFRLNTHDDDYFRGPVILRSTGVHDSHVRTET
ncbi:hypothetical protein O3G_MSEX000429 [Manduca sexta]|nr:hypothetical protein O3G_MSEX000429 [Manduca sexta]